MINLDDIKPLPGTEHAGTGMPTVNRIVIHCSATPPGGYIDSARRIHNMHVRDNGWDAIGYHYIVKLDGSIEGGRPLTRTGAGVRVYNKDSIHICLIGGLNADRKPSASEYTQEQWDSLRELCLILYRKYSGPEIVGHTDLDPLKACPCFDVEFWVQKELQIYKQELQPELPETLTINGVEYRRA
jgi:N-acetylmuramoyl-L-alanine amidase